MRKKLKFIIMIFILITSVWLKAKIVAEVGDFQITKEELQDKILQLPDSLSYKKRIAYNILVDEALLLNYAKENRITVSETELDDFFISQLGDDPSLQTNGEFDYDKFIKLKQSERGKKIMNIMRRDILIKKSKDLVIESFELTDNTLLEQFIVNSLNVDIDYALLNVNSLDISADCSTDKAIKYYENNRNLFMSKPSKIFRFSIDRFSSFSDSAKFIAETKVNNLPDSLYSDNSVKDSLFSKVYQSALDSLAYVSAIEKYKLFRSSKDDSIKYYETYRIYEDEKFDDFPNGFSSKIDIGDVTLPFKTKYGYVVLKCQKRIPQTYLPLSKVKEKVWQKYIDICKNNEQEYYKFFKTHIDSFYTNASMVEILKLPKNIKKISEIQDKFFNDKLTKYKNRIEKKIIFLRKFRNEKIIYDKIAEKINNAMERGVAEDEDNYYIFKELLNFPEYIPDFNLVKNQMPEIEKESLIDTVLIKKYYENNKRNMVSVDSVKLGFAYFPFETDTIKVDNQIIKDYFYKNQKEFTRPVPSIKLDYIAVPDSLTAKNIVYYLKRGDNFNFLKNLYNVDEDLITDQEIPIKTLNDTLKKVLNNTPLKAYSAPFYYRNNWIVLYKKDFFNTKYKKFAEVKDEIVKIIKLKKAKEIAYQKAKTVFDSTRYFSHCNRFVDSKYILKTKFQSFDEPFDILGDMSYYKDELMRIWKNVKLTSLVKTDSGYAVVFLLQKKNKKKLTFEEAKTRIIKILSEEEKLKRAQQNAKIIREKIIKGANPDSLLFFVGKWYRVKNLKLNSIIPGLDKKLSSLVLLDISKHQTGYISPVLKLNLKNLIFYKINRLEKVSRKEFYKNKNKIKRQMIEKKLREWLDDYKKKIIVKFYGY